MAPVKRPIWWEWELELSPHVLKRMVDRQFSELDLRHMFSTAAGCQRDAVTGRWLVVTRHARRRWEIIVEPDHNACRVVVITAYPVSDAL